MFGKVDNSKLTPEFNNNGQGQQNTAANNQVEPNAQAISQGEQVAQNGQGEQLNQNQVDGIQVGEEVFNSQDDLINAYNSMKEELANRNKSYKELQGEYTRSRQEIAMRNKMATPSSNRPVVQPIMPQPQMPNMFNQNNPYNSPINQPYVGVNPRVGMPTQPMYNPYQPQYQQAPVVNEAMINMAAEAKITELKNSDPDFDEVAAELWNVMENDNYFANIKFTDPDMAKNAIGAAYQMAKQKIETAKANVKINNAKAEAYNNKQQKVLNNDNSNVASRGKTRVEKTDAEKVKESIIGAIPQIF